MFQVLGRVLDKQAIARLDNDRGQLGEKQGLGPLDLVDTQVAIRFGQHFRQRLAVGKAASL